MRPVRAIVILACTAFWFLGASAQNSEWSARVKATYTTDGQILPSLTSSSPFSRSLSIPLQDVVGMGAEIRFRFPSSNIMIGLGAERIECSEDRSLSLVSGRTLPVQDGVSVIPVELSGYFIVPVSGERFRMIMGAGGGVYIGERTYSFAGVNATSLKEKPGFGIHVSAGVGFRILQWLSLCAEMKFRDVQFTATNQFPAGQVWYEGSVVNLSKAPFSSAVHIDGVVFEAAASIDF